uniref:Retrotransposon protein, putative, unclassified n=2 Tax=Oryza sativa subsp. japonica TaxID=39947 RepID=Q2R7B4_ORYSJ|nr:retrotransposon protein, putative, unclassified [Oryza sativa Japonica Group]AAX96221.1 retrotransposon protein, putative, unclassified [Oryza sativa Japonica Group]ABA92677.1 retrotransposon protein, putative, unclassified [Oryza sativa Japonica Group]
MVHCGGLCCARAPGLEWYIPGLEIGLCSRDGCSEWLGLCNRMVNTRASGSGNNNNEGNPTLAQVLAQQTQLMNMMIQQMQNQLNQGNNNAPPPQNKLADFLRVRPPTFSTTTNPVEAGDWLHAVEKKLELLQCTDQEKVVFASHQLQGPASEWWDHFRMNRAEGQPITWAEFTETFKKIHIPVGVVALKKREFRALKQKDRTVAEYLHEFNRLARYAPEDVRTDEERQEKFLEGLKDELSVTLISHDYVDFQQLVDKAIRLEDKKNRMDNRKRKMIVFQEAQGSSQRQRIKPLQIGESSSVGQGQSQQLNIGGEIKLETKESNEVNIEQANQPVPVQQNQSQENNSSGREQQVCFNCYKPGHFARECPKPKHQQPQGQVNNIVVTGANAVPVASSRVVSSSVTTQPPVSKLQ